MTGATMTDQEAEFQQYRATCHARGQCEFSGLRVSECVESICDCFETPAGAAAIEAAATEPLVPLEFTDELCGYCRTGHIRPGMEQRCCFDKHCDNETCPEMPRYCLEN